MKTGRINKAHRKFINGLPCAVCERNPPSECAHVRLSEFGDLIVPIEERGGTGIKPHDKWTVPLCHDHHTIQHNGGERPFWEARHINPLAVAQALWANTGQRLACFNILERHRNGENG